MDSPVVVLAGGTGGAKLARGMADVVDPADLIVIANTGDDVELYGAHVSPDPDLILFHLADRIDARGWGLDGDTFHAMDRLRARGEDIWFNLGDEDLEIGRDRLRRLQNNQRLTDALKALAHTLGVQTTVLPMSDDPVRTWVDDTPFQEWMIRRGGKAAETHIDRVELRGIEQATPPPELLNAVRTAQAIIIGPSNPIISIGPILAVPGVRAALQTSPAPVVAVSPFVAGESVKGPTVPFMRAAGAEPTPAGVAELYADVLDGLVADEPVDGIATHVTDVLMSDRAGQARLAQTALEFAQSGCQA